MAGYPGTLSPLPRVHLVLRVEMRPRSWPVVLMAVQACVHTCVKTKFWDGQLKEEKKKTPTVQGRTKQNRCQ